MRTTLQVGCDEIPARLTRGPQRVLGVVAMITISATH